MASVTTHRPADAEAARAMVVHAYADGETIEIVGGGSKRRLGRPTQCDHLLDISALAGVVDYDPAELVLTAQAATPMTEIETLLSAHGQMLAFEPPDWGGLLGGEGAPTLGGVVACNLSGPRRVRAGAARDHLLGLAAINGRGEAWRSGGRVVKNVTGYDMCKLQAGAYGTLSVLTEMSVRVVPRSETSCSIVLHGLSDAQAIEVLARALNAPHEVSAAAHLPASVAVRAGMPGPATVLRLEGPAPSVSFRSGALRALFGEGTVLESDASARLWAEIGAVASLLPAEGRVVWRVSPTPAMAASFVGAVQARMPAEAFYDWGGGLVWLGLGARDAGADGGAAVVRGAMAGVGGHAMLMVAPDDLRAAMDVFQPEPATLAALSDRVKDSFDPRRILNPGRTQKGR